MKWLYHHVTRSVNAVPFTVLPPRKDNSIVILGDPISKFNIKEVQFLQGFAISASITQSSATCHKPTWFQKNVPTSSGGADTAEAIFRARKIPLLAAGLVALGFGVYFSMMVSSLSRQSSSASTSSSSTADEATPTGRPPAFSRESARQFDQCLDASEKTMGISSLRKDLGRAVSGHVIEVAVGTGRNMSFYDWRKILPSSRRGGEPVSKTATSPPAMLSYTGVDVSPDMLEVAIEKLPGTLPGLRGVTPAVTTQPRTGADKKGLKFFSFLDGKLRLAQCDIQHTIPPPAADLTGGQEKYDTVVQTFGLCSVADPGQVIRNLAGMVKPGTGKIILIEHGRARWGIVNTLLDWSAPSHFQKYGCWWNRDIVGIVEAAAEKTPGLRVVRVERPFITQLGTTVWLELAVDRIHGTNTTASTATTRANNVKS
ncbi:hypothetical protein SODALDRAFT_355554 [Sodiomyces alkalinus F11]|uniref:S-adenosyl-L-methionine-dependent methyltransferase n=1 Tax=Sodiomyces alkalinus (strain CBS 110278 / VKM F-3762 / F11) TaxID=1314773 RepID=A0A3N2Q997_SODAK|nr:hypothetical protein SODALDRAFT_355554 [Sodiomyces alkalinus F11]ROT43349.1 hypothetical protein SODALDRAFT_355554 [Sodiomyces alkalinus F11]